jgi:hypothetical protein
MAKPYTDITPYELEELAYQYIDECLENTKEVVAQYKTIDIRDRHIPTVEYFLRIWVVKKGKPTISRVTYYNWLNDEREGESNKEKFNTIKRIDKLFKSLAEDIVANEGKGIFYAKNRLGMRNEPKDDDKPQEKIQIEIINGKGDIKDD